MVRMAEVVSDAGLSSATVSVSPSSLGCYKTVRHVKVCCKLKLCPAVKCSLVATPRGQGDVCSMPPPPKV